MSNRRICRHQPNIVSVIVFEEPSLYPENQHRPAIKLNEKILFVLNEQILLFVASERPGPACATSKEFEEFEKEYFNSGREVPQRYEDAHDLHKYRMRLS